MARTDTARRRLMRDWPAFPNELRKLYPKELVADRISAAWHIPRADGRALLLAACEKASGLTPHSWPGHGGNAYF